MVKDFLGDELKEGDIVLRCKFSSFTFHKIIRFTKKRIVLSCKRKLFKGFQGVEYEFLMDSVEVNDLKNHDQIMYINKTANLSLIKYKNKKII